MIASRAHQHVLEAHHVLEARGHRLPRTLCFPELTLPGKLLLGRGSMDHPPRSLRRRQLLPPLHLLALLQLRLLARGHHPLPVSTVATTCCNSSRGPCELFLKLRHQSLRQFLFIYCTLLRQRPTPNTDQDRPCSTALPRFPAEARHTRVSSPIQQQQHVKLYGPSDWSA